jgi:hypothetical protein
MYAFLRKLFWIFIALDVCSLVAVAILERSSPGALVLIRTSIFSKFVSNPNDLEPPPAELAKRGFLEDPPEMVAKWRQVLSDSVRYSGLFTELAKTTSTIDKAKLITRTFSRGGSLVSYDHNANLLLKLITIVEPRGSCSDHVQVFQALANIAGLDSLNLWTGLHETAAVYCPEWSRWVWIDPEFSLLAKNTDGTYMSPLELRKANLDGATINYEFFGTPSKPTTVTKPEIDLVYQPANFSSVFGVVWGNNVLSANACAQGWCAIPKSFRQSVMIPLGLKPGYRVLDDGQATSAKCRLIKNVSWCLLILFCIGNFSYPLYFVVVGFSRRIRAAVPAATSASREVATAELSQTVSV